MKILIIESESYLAQSIANKLGALGHECTNAASLATAAGLAEEFEAVLLSTSWSGASFYPLIEKFRRSIIILMVAYVDSETVLNPVKAGATDYIQKPFMIEELIKKIEHYAQFRSLKSQNEAYEALLKEASLSCEIPHTRLAQIKFPLLLRGDAAARAAAVFKIALALKSRLKILSAQSPEPLERGAEIFYAPDFDSLSGAQKEKFLSKTKSMRIIAGSIGAQKGFNDEITLGSSKERSEILSIEEYVKLTIVAHQDEYFDSDLAAALGISRKSLWEKRKKYGIARKK
ncbi:response regulator [uncultured Campylobacter sp.]|uniref:response regulator n=1 Tax=uncultured Campylobacter sp. TaxID=218934 RepID=UPI002602043A|nr:response regulator [uncultured Campylobacter sp.]